MTAISYERLEIHSIPSTENVPLGFWENRVREVSHPEFHTIQVLPTRQEAARMAAEKILEVVKNKPDAAISFPTGNQAKSVYDELARIAKERNVSFADVQAFQVDAYFPVPNDHPNSFRKYLQEHVWGPLGLTPENVHEIPADPGADGDKVAKEYEALLAKQDIDLVLHPIGCGGHMGFNEKGTPFTSVTHVAALSPETVYRDQVERGQTSPDCAITQGIATISRAKHIIFIDFDPKYQEDMAVALYGEISENNPSSCLRSVGKNVDVILTQEVYDHIAQRPGPNLPTSA